MPTKRIKILISQNIIGVFKKSTVAVMVMLKIWVIKLKGSRIVEKMVNSRIISFNLLETRDSFVCSSDSIVSL
ncbi:MAG: hypothetical protein UX53_C0007G0017 [Candidatus Azambacteria bacterium GW2011_GWB2_46_37]|uniref:Uncharacterized protein n=1 Tax=Candidatus Azambacteria bacterium GW2011_GWB2_46_37 TaxID=1618618 RepID=A0A0G1Q3M1_9BACT|nr:MAG: hypothetical protein UX53_C0007G0017 [Candidatus Azambacteria bacterium GW2011_GWB2_46_37]